MFHFGVATNEPLLFHSGFLAVDFFFVLSGFVISTAYEKRLLSRMSIWDFVVRRIIRLYPLLFISTLSAIAITFHLHEVVDAKTMVLAIFLLPDHPGYFPLNGPAWSLFFEIIVNIMYASLLRLLSSFVIVVAASAGLLFWLHYSYLHGSLNVGQQDPQFIAGLGRIIFSFSIGVLIYRHVPRNFFLGRVTIVALALVLIAVTGRPELPGGNRFVDLSVVLIVLPALVAIGAVTVAPSGWIEMCKQLGRFSYPIYLFHYPMLQIVEKFNRADPLSGTGMIVAFSISLAAIVALSWALLTFMDEPLRARMDRWWQSRQAAAFQTMATWHKCRAPLFSKPTLSRGRTTGMGQIWRRRTSTGWEYKQDPEAQDDFGARRY